MSRYLGIDYGDKKIGIAISDEGGSFAFPKEVLENRPAHKAGLQGNKKHIFSVPDELKKIISLECVSVVIVGLPQNFSGEDTEQTKKVRAFADELKQELTVDVVFENEILTSRQIEKTGASTKAMIDASSAALILQGYLDRMRKDAKD